MAVRGFLKQKNIRPRSEERKQELENSTLSAAAAHTASHGEKRVLTASSRAYLERPGDGTGLHWRRPRQLCSIVYGVIKTCCRIPRENQLVSHSSGWKQYLPLTHRRRRYEQRRFMVEGVRLCREALASGWPVEAALVTAEFRQSQHRREFEELFRQREIAWQILTARQFRQLADTETPQGVLLVMPMPSFPLSAPAAPTVVVLVDGVRDPGNLGTIIRTADWFAAARVILSADTVDPFNPKVLRGSMGSVFHLPVYHAADFLKEIDDLKKEGFQLLISTLHGKTAIEEISCGQRVALLIGNEAHGAAAELLPRADYQVKIPGYGRAESLNVAVAAGILLEKLTARIRQGEKRLEH